MTRMLQLLPEKMTGTWAGVLLSGILLVLFLLYVRFFRKRQVDFDTLSGNEFEEYCAQILAANGYRDITLTQVRGDHGVDILAEKDGLRYAIQCKCYAGSIGNKAVQEAYSGRDIYEADRAAVMTNSYFTPQATQDAEVLGVELWDREELLDLIRRAGKKVRSVPQTAGDKAEVPETFKKAAGFPAPEEEGVELNPVRGIYPQGQYITGEEIPCGEYLAQSIGPVYARVILYADYAHYLAEDALSNDLFTGDYHLTLREEGMILHLHAAYLRRKL